jgi:hypothetical protein
MILAREEGLQLLTQFDAKDPSSTIEYSDFIALTRTYRGLLRPLYQAQHKMRRDIVALWYWKHIARRDNRNGKIDAFASFYKRSPPQSEQFQLLGNRVSAERAAAQLKAARDKMRVVPMYPEKEKEVGQGELLRGHKGKKSTVVGSGNKDYDGIFEGVSLSGDGDSGRNNNSSGGSYGYGHNGDDRSVDIGGVDAESRFDGGFLVRRPTTRGGDGNGKSNGRPSSRAGAAGRGAPAKEVGAAIGSTIKHSWPPSRDEAEDNLKQRLTKNRYMPTEERPIVTPALLPQRSATYIRNISR